MERELKDSIAFLAQQNQFLLARLERVERELELKKDALGFVANQSRYAINRLETIDKPTHIELPRKLFAKVNEIGTLASDLINRPVPKPGENGRDGVDSPIKRICGDFVKGKKYKKGDMVFTSGSSFVALKDNEGEDPFFSDQKKLIGDTTKIWQIVAAGGRNGITVSRPSDEGGSITIRQNGIVKQATAINLDFKGITVDGVGVDSAEINLDPIEQTITYDAQDRMVSLSDARGTMTYNWNAQGYLERIDGTGLYKTKTFTYDGDNNLVSVTIS